MNNVKDVIFSGIEQITPYEYTIQRRLIDLEQFYSKAMIHGILVSGSITINEDLKELRSRGSLNIRINPLMGAWLSDDPKESEVLRIHLSNLILGVSDNANIISGAFVGLGYSFMSPEFVNILIEDFLALSKVG